MTAVVVPEEEWRALAACSSADEASFFKATPDVAKQTCRRCPVRGECLYDAVQADPPIGVWGGLTRKERHRLPELPPTRTAAVTSLRLLAAVADTRPPTPAPAKPGPERAKAQPPAVKRARRAAADGKSSAPKPRAKARRKKTAAAAAPAQAAAVADAAATSAQVQVQVPAARLPFGTRYTPRQRAVYERLIVEQLRAGATYSQIIERIGVTAPTIVRVRRKYGLPRSTNKPVNPNTRSVAEALAVTTEQYGNGHTRWTGPLARRSLLLHAEGRRFNARRLLFEQHHGRPPVGPVRSNCGEQQCITGAHLTDSTLRSPTPQRRRARRPKPAPERTTPAMTTQPSTAAATAEALPVDQLLEWGDAHTDPEVQDQAARARVALVGLRRRHAADAELTAITSEAEQLEKRLAELRARQAELTPAKKTAKKQAVQRDYEPATVRAWAKDNGVDCPATGRVPKAVVEAWRAAAQNTSARTS
ncbi:histone-like nucleoid-structuring protein Lsr2 [Streptomyces sp. PAM3C]|uniref:WhiB family transcriptional regulator n=1 Tax=Streptomyces sp. PAM3C TaxID=2847300 RepID=UPI001C1DD8CB|nr:histone-like nucleoid-structuring protein Lsr2 [Streptomyces sp. PAM3C]MBU5946762.1 WhiB family transcriptional regulator [Streptomyces sp. PAM3C]